MATITNFQPSSQAAFQFQAAFDGNWCTVICTWNLFGQRYYINIYDLSGALILCRAMTGSPIGYDINLVAGYFTTSTLVFRSPTQQFEVTP
jgi:hypothetical protein